jgi:hypothetical protein
MGPEWGRLCEDRRMHVPWDGYGQPFLPSLSLMVFPMHQDETNETRQKKKNAAKNYGKTNDWLVEELSLASKK